MANLYNGYYPVTSADEMYSLYESIKQGMLDTSGTISIDNSEVVMNGSSKIANNMINTDGSSGDITINDSTIVAKGKNTLSATGDVKVNNSTLDIAQKAVLDVNTSDGKTLTMTDATLKLAGTLNADLSGSISNLILGKAFKHNGDILNDDFADNLNSFGVSGMTTTKDMVSAFNIYKRWKGNDASNSV